HPIRIEAGILAPLRKCISAAVWMFHAIALRSRWRRARSEVQLQRELADARIARAENGSKATRADVVHRVVEVLAVEEVEELRPEIQGHTIANGERLRDAEVSC